MFEQRKTALLAGCKLKLKFVPNDWDFYVKMPTSLKLKSVDFTKCRLYLQGHKCPRYIVEGINMNLAPPRVVTYNLLENFVVPHTIPSGTMDTPLDPVFTGQVPRRVFVMFVDHRAYNGSHLLNPYNFQNFGVNYLALYVNGNPVPGPPKTPNFQKGWYSKEYYDLFEVTNQDNMDTCITLTKENFVKGNNIFCFRCEPDTAPFGPGVINPIKQGVLRLQVRFDAPLKQAITCLVYLEFNTVLGITSERTVVYDYNI